MVQENKNCHVVQCLQKKFQNQSKQSLKICGKSLLLSKMFVKVTWQFYKSLYVFNLYYRYIIVFGYTDLP